MHELKHYTHYQLLPQHEATISWLAVGLSLVGIVAALWVLGGAANVLLGFNPLLLVP